MKILLVSVEVAPFAKVGGLADVAGSLPKELSNLGHDVKVVMPAYPMILENYEGQIESIGTMNVPLGLNQKEVAALYRLKVDGLDVLLIGSRRFDSCVDSASVYSPNRDAYLLFSSAVLEACLFQGWTPDVIHCNDWHTGFIPVLMREAFPTEWGTTGTVFTIHNLAYQGEFGPDTLDFVGLPQTLFNMHQLETYGAVNFLKSGCSYSDQVNTVSPNYAQEIMTPEFGCRLEGLMIHLKEAGRLSGILNGIDLEIFNSETDSHIPAHFSIADPSGKKICSKKLREEVGLPEIPGALLLGVVSRLSNQKGFDLIIESAEKFLALPCQLIVQGLGDPWAAEKLTELQKLYPDRVRLVQKFDAEFAQRVYAGSDAFLMPSSFEPCGLGQMIAFRYGTLPIVRKTGGLADTVFEGINGFVFEERSADQLLVTIERAHQTFGNSEKWSKLMLNAMSGDYGWSKSAGEYVKIYEKAIAARPKESDFFIPKNPARVEKRSQD